MGSLTVKVRFFSDKRNSFPSLCGGEYRPHLVASGDNEYLGVEFLSSDLVEFDKLGQAEIRLVYDTVDYSKLKAGVAFNIVEGQNVVGEGIVL